MRSGHVTPHLHDEVVLGRWRTPGTLGLGGVALFTCRTVSDAENNVKELDEAALRVAAAGILPIRLGSRAILVDDAVRQSSLGHILASGKKGADAVVEDGGIATLVHALQKSSEVIQKLRKRAETPGD